MAWPYRRRRAALEDLFTEHTLTAPWALCPSATEADTVNEWLSWSAVGLEGIVFKRLDSRHEPSARGWRKYKVRETQEAIVGAFTGPLTAPRTLLLGRFDKGGRPQYTGRTPTLPQTAGHALAPLLAPAGSERPWTSWTFSAGWGTRRP
ncbi:ATP-dependent DNA ligase [Streptomyces sp. DSM 40750]|uniref:ATP-dependent DNA ligase n=1 Tax=Streptomyces sp. DSM 40750 TaxID=2801030 RepID=UPI00214B94A5|nr:hypothetical protein [Streptomyces sp. DSM 40750]UUU19176.1 hypothetical protein JIX55_01890 [Streptomyces sp. DSM 40750]UUU27480.1 hypothetical protein JIX55_48855 [Streptomyces sp. DSM 40750]